MKQMEVNFGQSTFIFCRERFLAWIDPENNSFHLNVIEKHVRKCHKPLKSRKDSVAILVSL